MLQIFWKQWQREYLTNLREQHAGTAKATLSGETATIGKVVLIHDNTPRSQWRLGVITELHPGKDGFVRAVTLKTGNGNMLSRPIERLYPIEVSTDCIETKLTGDETKLESEEERKSRPSRVAGRKAKDKIKKHFELNEE